MMLELLSNPDTYFSLLTLTVLEIVLGIDNIIFISILVGKLPAEERQKARVIGLAMAVLGRLGLLGTIVWLTKLTEPLFTLFSLAVSGKDLVMLGGGLFLVAKSAQEIYDKVEGSPHGKLGGAHRKATYASIIGQIILIDMVFSIDSIITAVGLVTNIAIMVVAILIALAMMILSANSIGDFIDRHPSVKVLALSFLLMIGTLLIAEGFHAHVPKGYIYFSLAFAFFVELINIKVKSKNRKRALNSASEH